MPRDRYTPPIREICDHLFRRYGVHETPQRRRPCVTPYRAGVAACMSLAASAEAVMAAASTARQRHALELVHEMLVWGIHVGLIIAEEMPDGLTLTLIDLPDRPLVVPPRYRFSVEQVPERDLQWFPWAGYRLIARDFVPSPPRARRPRKKGAR